MRINDDKILYPQKTEELQEIICDSFKKNISMSVVDNYYQVDCHAKPQDSLSVSLTNLNKVIEYEPDNLSIIVEAGITNQSLNQFLSPGHLLFPTLASNPDLMLGQQIAHNDALLRGKKFGKWTDNILGLEFITFNGKIVRTGGKTLKNVSGYDLVPLLVGTNNSLGIITKLTLKLTPKPEKMTIVVCQLEEIHQLAKITKNIYEQIYNISALTFENNKSGIIKFQAELIGNAATVENQKEELKKLFNNFKFKDVEDIHTSCLAMPIFQQGLLIHTTKKDFFEIAGIIFKIIEVDKTSLNIAGDINNSLISIFSQEKGFESCLLKIINNLGKYELIFKNVNMPSINLPKIHFNQQYEIINSLKNKLTLSGNSRFEAMEETL